MCAQDIHPGPYGEFRAASGANGTALSTTAAFIQLPPGTRHVFLTPRNFSTAVVARVAFNPWLVVLKTMDNLATLPADYSEAAQDASTSTSVDISSINTLANGDFLLVGSHLPFRGVSIDVGGSMAGSNSPTLTVAYWDGSAWTSISATDNTNSGSKSMAVDGTVTWTVPAGTLWKAEGLREIFRRIGSAATEDVWNRNLYPDKLYWTRWVWSAQLNDTSVTLDSMLAMNRSTAYAEMVALVQPFERRIHRGLGGYGCIEALTDAGTANLLVNVDSGNSGRF